MKYKIFFLSVAMLWLSNCTDKKENTVKSPVIITNNSGRIAEADATNPVSCDESLTALIKSSDLKSPFKNDIKAEIESMEGTTLRVQLTVKSKGGVNSENIVGSLVINTGTKKILDITDDIENPVNVTYDKKNWDTFIDCNTQKKNTTTVNSANIEFSDLFNESTVIKFTPAQLNDTDPQIKEFKANLAAYENKYPESINFDPANLTSLVNDEVFANADYFTDSSWLNYFIKKYDVDVLEVPDLFEKAINQEDYDAVKVLISNGYIVSLKQVQLAKTIRAASDQNKLRNINNKGLDEQGDPILYVDKNSKIKEIENFLLQEYNSNTVNDKDGYVNVRKDKNSSSTIVDKINDGDKIEVLDNTGKWWQVRTKGGKEGYLFGEKVK